MNRKQVPSSATNEIKQRKMVRDSVIMPEDEYALIAVVKQRCLNMGLAVKKSEVLRAALALFASLEDARVVAAIQGLAVIKTGRPSKGKQ